MARAVPDETPELVGKLRAAAEHMAQFDRHAEKFEAAGLAPADIDSVDDFRRLPTMSAADLAADFTENPPWGSLVPSDRPVVRCNFTPSAHMSSMPVLWTETDIEFVTEGTVRGFRAAGMTDDDVVLNTGGLSESPFGWAVADAVEELGATHIPAGPGESQRKAEIVREYDVTAVVGFPSFLEKIANETDDPLDTVDLVVGSGEPFTAIDGYRERVREAYGGDPTVVDGYGLAELGGGWVAMGTEAEAGMRLFTERVFPEVIDPETGELVERGEKGELVLTMIGPETAPLLRFRTGDLTVMDRHGSDLVLPEGVFGRTDDQRKVKGMKLYPSELQMHLAGHPAVDPRNVQLYVQRPPGETDRLEIRVNADPSAVDRDDLQSDVESVLGVSVDSLVIDPDLEVPDDETVVEDR
jgi:phenylacetate-CoA ligase